jgi:hypothetical protein
MLFDQDDKGRNSWKRICDSSNGSYPEGHSTNDLAVYKAIIDSGLQKDVADLVTSVAMSLSRMKSTNVFVPCTPINDEVVIVDQHSSSGRSKRMKKQTDQVDLSADDNDVLSVTNDCKFSSEDIESQRVNALESVKTNLGSVGNTTPSVDEIAIGLKHLSPNEEFTSILDQILEDKYPNRDDLEVEYDVIDPTSGVSETLVRRLPSSFPSRKRLRDVLTNGEYVSQTVSRMSNIFFLFVYL